MVAGSTAFGACVGLMVSIPPIWVANARADDGPNFPPFLLAFGFLVLPAAVVLVVIQLSVLLLSRSTGAWSRRTYLAIGIASGVLTGVILIRLLGTPRSEPRFLTELILFGVVQGLATFWCYADASRRRWI